MTKEIGGNTYHYDEDEKLHCDDGPAAILKLNLGESKIWVQHGKLHRKDGPAIERSDGTVLYFLDDQQYSKEEYEEKIK